MPSRQEQAAGMGVEGDMMKIGGSMVEGVMQRPLLGPLRLPPGYGADQHSNYLDVGLPGGPPLPGPQPLRLRVVVESSDAPGLEPGTALLEVRLRLLTGSGGGPEHHFTLRAGERRGPEHAASFDLVGESPYVSRLEVRNVTSPGVTLNVRGIWLDPAGPVNPAGG
jgi:hypothetical protein